VRSSSAPLLQVFAKHTASNTFMGQIEIPLDPLMSGDILEDWFPLQMRRQGEEVPPYSCLCACVCVVCPGCARLSAQLNESQQVPSLVWLLFIGLFGFVPHRI
jgi:hypothetical protein